MGEVVGTPTDRMIEVVQPPAYLCRTLLPVAAFTRKALPTRVAITR